MTSHEYGQSRFVLLFGVPAGFLTCLSKCLLSRFDSLFPGTFLTCLLIALLSYFLLGSLPVDFLAALRLIRDG